MLPINLHPYAHDNMNEFCALSGLFWLIHMMLETWRGHNIMIDVWSSLISKMNMKVADIHSNGIYSPMSVTTSVGFASTIYIEALV